MQEIWHRVQRGVLRLFTTISAQECENETYVLYDSPDSRLECKFTEVTRPVRENE